MHPVHIIPWHLQSRFVGHQGAQPGWDGPFAWDEGDVQIAPGVYQIPRWVMQPKREQVSNLLVVAAPSASHIGMSTLRMEPQVSASPVSPIAVFQCLVRCFTHVRAAKVYVLRCCRTASHYTTRAAAPLPWPTLTVLHARVFGATLCRSS